MSIDGHRYAAGKGETDAGGDFLHTSKALTWFAWREFPSISRTAASAESAVLLNAFWFADDNEM
jgi:hypothetical protein